MTRGEQQRAADFLTNAACRCLASVQSLPRGDIIKKQEFAQAEAYMMAAAFLRGCADNTDSATPHREGE